MATFSVLIFENKWERIFLFSFSLRKLNFWAVISNKKDTPHTEYIEE